MYGVITWASIGIAVVVSVVLAWVLLKFRTRPGQPAPAQTREHTALEIAWTIAPAPVLLVIAILKDTESISINLRSFEPRIEPGYGIRVAYDFPVSIGRA